MLSRNTRFPKSVPKNIPKCLVVDMFLITFLLIICNVNTYKSPELNHAMYHFVTDLGTIYINDIQEN